MNFGRTGRVKLRREWMFKKNPGYGYSSIHTYLKSNELRAMGKVISPRAGEVGRPVVALLPPPLPEPFGGNRPYQLFELLLTLTACRIVSCL